ncbi:uncharacterized protein LOC5565630 [Aedes aegypti]|uniref:DUF4789 domain-containing protein n=1 Tax=Aedes aegypti TaxID=7159 RepID=A0A1S4G328_AEDAE|nr:uncharacterized protein LOC5565630 [Aedes aegypti]
MVRWIFVGVGTIVLAVITYGAPQLQQGTQQYPSRTTGVQPPVYKNNTQNNGTSELFAYPEDQSIIDSKQNAKNRTPVYIPNRCQKNEILYPGDQESDWVCDCKPTFVYHPPTRQCYQLFTQAFCSDGYMVTLQPDAKQPDCVQNTCFKPNSTIVPFNGDCVQLNAYYDRCSHGQLKKIVSVREDDNQLGCVNISDVPDHKTVLTVMEVERMTGANRGTAVNRNRRQ